MRNGFRPESNCDRDTTIREDAVDDVSALLDSLAKDDQLKAKVLMKKMDIKDYAYRERVHVKSAQRRIRTFKPKLRKLLREFQYDRD